MDAVRGSGGSCAFGPVRVVAAAACAGVLLAGCSSGPAAEDASEPGGTSESAQAGTGEGTSRGAAHGDDDRPVVVLDPGHNGGNAEHPDRIGRQIPDGRGGHKQCNSTGTSTEDGYPEHAFNLAVARSVQQRLAAEDVRVELTRSDDDGVGPCVDERAAIGNRADADAVVSIHADGTSADARGFHVIYSDPPVNDVQRGPARGLARDMVAGMSEAGLPTADYIASDAGYDGHADLAGLNHSTVPAVLVECGNMRNPDEARAMSTEHGRDTYAEAVARGVLRYLDR